MKKQTYDLEERRLEEKMNVQHRMLNERQRCRTRFSLRVSKRLKRNRNSHSSFDIGFLKTNEIKLRSGTTSLFDVERWTFDVGCSICSMFDVHLSKQHRTTVIYTLNPDPVQKENSR